MQTENQLFVQFRFLGLLDSVWSKDSLPDVSKLKPVRNYDEILPDSAQANVNQNVRNIAGSLRISSESMMGTLKDKERNLRKHQIEWHRKIVLSLACLVLFLIGAPLGSIIRKGGLGTPLVVAIIFFMVFYFSSTAGEKFAKENTLTPFGGMWMATFILLPIGLFLIYKAMRDSQLFNKDAYRRIPRALKIFFNKKA